MVGFTAADSDDLDLGVEDMEGIDDTGFAARPTGYEVNVSEGIADLTPVYDAAIQRLRAQRSGLTNRQRLGALLVGFGQPTRHGKWQEGVSNAANVMFQLSQQQRTEDMRRREKLEALANAREIAKVRSDALIKAAEIRAAKTGASSVIATALGHKPNADEVKRIGYAQRLWPQMEPQDLVKMLYHPKVEVFMLRPGVAAAAASQGTDVGSAIGSVSDAIGSPTLEEFLIEARKVNPGVSDDELKAYYQKKYGEM